MVCHEALFALLGHTGGLIESTKSGFRVSASATFLVEYERALLERIAKLGHSYVQLESFMARVRDCGTGASSRDAAAGEGRREGLGAEGIRDGLYLRALCTGLDEVLDVYRSMVLSVERMALEVPPPPCTL